jgi:signal transduction histidine kinase/ActR/RegA family two-component response regulator
VSAPSGSAPNAATTTFDLHRELRDAREQSMASREILAALGRDLANPGTVLDTIVEHATRLCSAQAAQLFLVDGDTFRVSRVCGETPDDYRQYLLQHPIGRDRSSTVGRAAEDMCTYQIPDVLADADYGRPDLQSRAGFRTLLSTPMILQDEVVGVLSIWRTAVAPFDQHECELVEEFAAQGAIVVRQRDLMTALEARGTDLADKVTQLKALQQVGEAVGSSLDLDEVLEQIVSNAVRLTNLGFGDITLRTDGGSILEYDEPSDTFHVRTAHGSHPHLLEQLRTITIDRESTLVGRTAMARHPLEVPDLARTELDPHLEILLRDGWRSVLAVPMLRGDTMIGVLVIGRRGTGSFPADVTELLETFASQSALAIVNARLFGELETKTRELEVASGHKSEFLASMSHELRTPLNAVIGFSEVLLDRLFGDINDRQDGYLRDIRNSGRHLLQLIEEILDLSKVESGHMVLEPSTIDIAGTLDWALAMVRERAAAHAIAITITVTDDVGTIHTDELKFKQVVLNLLSNAVKFTPDGGQVRVSAHRGDAEFVVTITDTGIGVAPEDQQRIFDSFQQGARGPSRHEGTGLGLTLSRRFVELMGGRMWLQSTAGAGSTFGFSIPLPEPDAGSIPLQRGEIPVVLLVDDDRASLNLMAAYLDASPVQVLQAGNGVDALDLTRKVLPAAVVLDIELPQLDGWAVLTALKADPATAAIPVIVVSAIDDRQRAMGHGADIYLQKPVRRREFVDALHRLDALTNPTVKHRTQQ